MTSWYEVLLISGGDGGYSGTGGAHAGNSGASYAAILYFTVGTEIPVTIGAGGLRAVGTSPQNSIYGGMTTFGSLLASDYTKIMEAAGLSVTRSPIFVGINQIFGYTSSTISSFSRAHGGGFGGGSASNSNADCDAVFFGGGGGGWSNGSAYYAGNGCQGAVRLRWHDPSKGQPQD